MSKDLSYSRFWVIASLIVAGLAAFWPSVWFDFVNWDDPAYVWNNDLIKSWSPSSLAGVATETVTRNYAPLTIFSLLIDHTLWGMNASGYHATNVILHVMNGLLVFLLVRQLCQNTFVAWTTAVLFLVHPVQIETVAWISSRKGLLSATFMLAALLVRLKPEPEAKHDMWYVVWLAAALLSKALAVVVPAIVLLYDIWVRRQKFADAFVRQIIPGVMCLLLLLKTMASQNSILGGVRGHLDFSIWHIMAIDSTILWRYIGMLFLPSDLCVLYDPPVHGIWKSVLLASAGWLMVGTAIWKYRSQHPLLLWGMTVWLLLLFPVLNFFRITTLMNDRYLYLPCIVIFATTAAAVHRLLNVSPERVGNVTHRLVAGFRWTLATAACVAALCITSSHLPVWRNSQSLWTHAMQKVPQLAVVRIQMAHTLHDGGQCREAIRTLQRALLQCQPDQLDHRRIIRLADAWQKELQTRSAAKSGPATR
ncbi:MAG: hypothetical protein RIK87_15525 [Fuerstiella sp.]